MALKEKVYFKLTTKEYREEKELAYLNRKVNTNMQQISNMEALIQKKTALLAARQASPPPPTGLASPHAPSAPLAPPHTSSASIDTPDTIQADVHVPPIMSNSTTTSRTMVHKK